ncbi:hypothetical protein SGPA1_12397 [Streptomyces misionensis JCM 4497]
MFVLVRAIVSGVVHGWWQIRTGRAGGGLSHVSHACVRAIEDRRTAAERGRDRRGRDRPATARGASLRR